MMMKNIKVKVDIARKLKVEAAKLDMSVQSLVDAFLRAAVQNQARAEGNIMPRTDSK